MRLNRKATWCGAAMLSMGCAVAVVAQERPDVADSGTLSVLTAEIRQLRLAVEESTRAQTQTQALAVYLSAEQSRLVQVAARLDAARKDLDAVTARSRQIAAQLANIDEVLARTTDADERSRLALEGPALKREVERVTLQEQVARSREAELLQMLQTEDARWSDLISRLEQLIKR